jgi:RND family efflux transporter MFP subunit
MSTTAPRSIPRPPRRLATRVLLPTVILAGAAGAVLWAGWRTFAPATGVHVVQVVLRNAADLSGPAAADTGGTAAPGGAGAVGTGNAGSARDTSAPAPDILAGPIVQAPGWVEPAPFPVMVGALTPGVVRDVLVLEGDRVEKGQVLAELHDEEQAIALAMAQAALDEQEARLAEMADELGRKERLVDAGAVSAAEVARLRLRRGAMEAGIRAARAERDMRALALERTKVRAPKDGVVMARLASPGMVAGAMQDGKPLIELYDPANLQVRADVPLADAGMVAIGQGAEIQVDVLPDRIFHGTVVRLVHQADIAKNTVQAKVLLRDPAPELKPDMLARVRIAARRGSGASGGTGASGGPGGGAVRQRVWAPARGVRRTGAEAVAAVVTDLRDGIGVVARRAVRLSGAERDGWYEVTDGLRPGDLLVTTDSPAVADGERVRVLSGPPGLASGGTGAEGSGHGDH